MFSSAIVETPQSHELGWKPGYRTAPIEELLQCRNTTIPRVGMETTSQGGNENGNYDNK